MGGQKGERKYHIGFTALRRRLPTTAAPSTTPPATSAMKWRPRYSRESAVTVMIAAARARSRAERKAMAAPPQNAVAVLTALDGKPKEALDPSRTAAMARGSGRSNNPLPPAAVNRVSFGAPSAISPTRLSTSEGRGSASNSFRKPVTSSVQSTACPSTRPARKLMPKATTRTIAPSTSG